jgi:hypothetical protein
MITTKTDRREVGHRPLTSLQTRGRREESEELRRPLLDRLHPATWEPAGGAEHRVSLQRAVKQLDHGMREDGLMSMSRIAAVVAVVCGLLAANAGEWGVAAVCTVLALLVVFAGDR